MASGPRDKIVEHHFSARFVEIDGQFIAIDGNDAAIAEFYMENPVSGAKSTAGPAGTGQHFALDLDRWPRQTEGGTARCRRFFERALPFVGLLLLCPLPTWGCISRPEGSHPVEAAGAVVKMDRRFGDFDMGFGQFVDKPAGNGGIPHAVQATIVAK